MARPRLERLLDHLRRVASREIHQPLLPELPDGRWWASWLLSPDELERVETLPLRDLGHGYDAFGMSRGGMAMGFAITHWLYHHWFRVTSHGVENIPAEGPVVVAANHSGMIPLDALMLCADILRTSPNPRVPRAIMDYFVGQLPFVSELFTRAGGIGGARANFHELLSNGEMIVVFPEGTRGIGKGWALRYQLQRWTEGHVELAIRHGAPVVPVAIIGAEEQMPQVAKLPLRLFGSPYLPVPATLVPLPVHFHIWYGEPIPVNDHPPEAAMDPEIVAAAALQVRDAVDALIRRGLAERPGVFA